MRLRFAPRIPRNLNGGMNQPAPVRYALVDEDDIPLTWDPVPVPRPTYTLKSRALRPDPEPAAVTPEAAFAPEAGHPAYRMEPERRVAGI